MKIRFLPFSLVCALALCLAASTASASNYCVGSSPACTGSPVADFSFDRQGVLDAVAAANGHTGPDTIYIAEGTISLTTQMSPTTPSGETVEVIGAGVGKTIFNGTVSSSPQIYWDFGDSTSSATGFSINANGAVNGGSGMFLQRGTVSDVEITEGQTGNSGYVGASVLGGGTLEDVSIMNASSGSGGVYATSGSATLTNVTLEGTGSGTGVYISPSAANTFNLTRVSITNFGYGIYQVAGNLNLNDSLIEMGAVTAGTGIYAFNGGAPVATIAARINRVTIVGSGSTQRGMYFGANAPSGKFDGESKDLLIYGTGSGFISQTCASGASAANPSWMYNDVIATNAPFSWGGYCSPGWNIKMDLAVDNPEFRDFAGGDYRPAWNSPLIDAGTSSGALDLAGNPRVVDGDGNGTSKVDVGAYEYQRGAPTVSIAGPSSLALLEASTFTANASDPEGEDLTYAWTIDGAASQINIATLSGGFISAGTHTLAVTVTDESGASATATHNVTVAAAKVADPPASACPVPTLAAKIKTKPTRAFKLAGKGFSIAKAKAEQPFVALTAPISDIKITLQSIGKKKLKTLKGSQTIKLKSTSTKLSFGGKWNRKKLKAGRYRATITVLAADSCTVVTPATVDFKLN